MSENSSQENKDIVSYHTFMFPFTIEDDEFELKKIEKELKKEKWNPIPFDIDGVQGNWNDENIYNYNEYVYFYPMVQKLLYNQNSNVNNKDLSVYFENKKINKNSKYLIKISEEKEYTLNISSIALRIFKTGVGILSYHLENYDITTKKKDILKINEFGRRVYPQFIPLEKSKGNILANELKIEGIPSENFENYLENKRVRLSKTITELLGEKLSEKIKPLIDDRMFTLCWYGNNEFSKMLQLKIEESSDYNYLADEKWAEFIFVDGDGNTCQSDIMLKELLKKHTYDRWVNYGTLYGISRYSFVCLTPSFNVLKKVKADSILNHMKTMYYQIMVIALMQRASTLKFKHKISTLVGEKNSEKIRNLQQEYIEFINSMNFREVTAQEQGIEMYNMVRDIMGINEAVRELEEEIQELHNFHAMLESEKVSRNSENLALIAGVVVVPTLLITLSSIIKFETIIPDVNRVLIDKNKVIFYGGVFPIGLTLLILKFKIWVTNGKKLKNRILDIMTDEILILVLVLIGYLIWIA